MAYSKDGRWVAATYEKPVDNDASDAYPQTVVIDLQHGSVVRHPHTVLSPRGDESWIPSTAVSCALRSDAYGTRMQSIDLEIGERTPLLDASMQPVARLGHRFVIQHLPAHMTGDQLHLETVTNQGTDRQPLWAVTDPATLLSVDRAVPGVRRRITG
ncbi:hypothetical protein [Asanoa iriomotensis]|uniref:Xaa-Pro dipeptidyl-peptidase C-terminal domain-containing protein n=1 Tax=Asanoa iriomotensis TaxID=234613 RepID=A0ABQ4C9X8_9ACTN|nr:hypothetical protein [Asanoa iriomotensis]GIF59577.1 hypothetical protein Air01nite_56720 [Asanoa iriomotensis]